MDGIFATHGMHGVFDGGAAWFWPVMIAVKVAFWAFVIWLVVRFARPWLRSRQPRGPERILDERFAEGSIGEEEYRQRLSVIRGSHEVR